MRGPGGWITCYWRHLDRVPVPFGELAWDHARRQLAADGHAATEQQIADAVAALLRRAYQGPQDKQAEDDEEGQAGRRADEGSHPARHGSG